MKNLSPSNALWPALLTERLGESAPPRLTALGNLELLKLRKTALLCSARCPGKFILHTYDQVAQCRDSRRCIISGFHSPVEKECLRILLRGAPPIIICPARSLPKRIPSEWTKPLDAGNLLILSGFTEKEHRVTADLAKRRNELVAALCDEAWFAHITPGGQAEGLTRRLIEWKIPFTTGSG